MAKAKENKKRSEKGSVVKPTKYTEETQAASFEPVSVAMGAADSEYPQTRSRRNVGAITERSYKYKNIEDGFTPFTHNKSYDSGLTTVSVREAVILCQKAYYNTEAVKAAIDLAVDFSCTDIYLKGSTPKIRKFYEIWFDKIQLDMLKESFFIEHLRSGNSFFYPYFCRLKDADFGEVSSLYGNKKKMANKTAKIPIRYTILNPADIQVTGAASMNIPIYYKTLQGYELETLRNPRTKEDKEIVENLPDLIKQQIKNKASIVLLPLDVKDITAIFNKKLPYEPLATPLLFPILESLNARLELRKIDQALARSASQVILLLTTGADPDKGGINQANIIALQRLMENNSISRTLISDHNTRASYITAPVENLLDPKKYEILDKDINTILNNILIGSEKFANQSSKIDVFLARLEKSQKTFLSSFLVPQIKLVAEQMGFDEGNLPIPYFDNVELKDNTGKLRVYTRLIELGVLTPEAGLDLIETGRIPTALELIEGQKELKKSRDLGYYVPLVGGSNQSENGRPQGTGTPKVSNKVGEIGTKANVNASSNYSIAKIVENMKLCQKLDEQIQTNIKTSFKIDQLNDYHLDIAEKIRNLVIANEEPEHWLEKSEIYSNEPIDRNKERVSRMLDIAAKHDLDGYLGAILLASEKEK